MLSLKAQIAQIIYDSMQKTIDRERWLAAEISELAIKYQGLDAIILEAITPMVHLYSNGSLDDKKLLQDTGTDASSLQGYIDILIEYDFLATCSESGEYVLTIKGTSACVDIFKNVIVRKIFELKRELDHIETLNFRLSEL